MQMVTLCRLSCPHGVKKEQSFEKAFIDAIENVPTNPFGGLSQGRTQTQWGKPWPRDMIGAAGLDPVGGPFQSAL